jgi:DNA end-binding protein Ku
MARAMWSGAISFGLVNVPVRLHPATSHQEVRFHMLHKKDGARIKQQRVCSQDGQEVPWEEIAKGYELSPGRYVMLDKEEIAALNPRADRTIAIEDFVEQEEIDPIYFENAYYLVPDKGAGRAYALLMEAMRRTGKVGIARVVLRTRQYLCAVRPMGEVLALSTMLYADEVNDVSELDAVAGAEAAPRPRELEMAEQLIESLTVKFDPQKYQDEHRAEVLALIERKAQGEEIVAPQVTEEPAKVINLMDALQASLKSMQRDKGEQDTGERRHRAQAAKTSSKPAAKKKAPAKKKRGSG